MKFLYFILLLPLSVFSQIKINSELIPYEMELMIKHLEKFPPSEEVTPLNDELKIIGQDMSFSDKEISYFLFKSEIYKQILDNEVIRLEAGSIRVTSALIKEIKKKIDENKLVYSDFSQWIILSMTSDLNPYIQDGFLDKSENINRNNEKDLLRLKNLQKMMSYLSPWLEIFSRMTPQQFNQIVSTLSRNTIHKIAQKTFYFQNFSLKLEKQEAQELFTFPASSPATASKKEAIENINAPRGLSEESQNRKEEAVQSVEDLEANPLEASELIDKLPLDSATNTEWEPSP